MSKIWHVAAECAPLAKVGGLADVVGALPKYQRNHGLDACVLMPGYQHLLDRFGSQKIHEGQIDFAASRLAYTVHQLDKDLGFPVLFIKPAFHFDEPGVYAIQNSNDQFQNESQRFPSFQACAVDYLKTQVDNESIVHVHDHHTGLIPLIWGRSDSRPPFVFTIHSAEYQGSFSNQVLRDLGISLGHLEAHDYMSYGSFDINSMRLAISQSDAVTTVSPSYSKQLLDDPSLSHGLNDALVRNANKLSGILNGIDPEVWSPEQDSLIEHNFSLESLEGKRKNKIALCQELGLDEELPLMVFIGRLKREKGAALLLEALHRLKEHRGFACVILGTGDSYLESEYKVLEEQWGDTRSLQTILQFNNVLAHKLYASADVLLMPSLVEPCGLNQMYALRYGTIPLVHAVGGLIDSISDWNAATSQGNGFKFFSPDWAELATKIIQLRDLWSGDSWQKIVENAMTEDFSWDRSVQDYIALYKELKSR